MIELKANIWDEQFDGYWRAITINTTIKSNGNLVMGSGLAKQAAERCPSLPEILGTFYSINAGYTGLDIFTWCGSTKFNGAKIIAFPTKTDWRKPSDLALIKRNLKSLHDFKKNNQLSGKIVCPRLGCGFGQLDWETQVRPLVEKYFGDNDNFIVINY